MSPSSSGPAAVLLVVASLGAAAQGPPEVEPREEAALRAAIVRGHADWCHHVYVESARTAAELAGAVRDLVERPSRESLDAARHAWIAGRRVYVLTEALRFCGGPIEAFEPSLNAWPIDEAYIDSVAGREGCGIVNDEKRFPQLGETVLLVANERGGETNISVGWHAIEFLLWGQDLDPSGPGQRPVSDYVPGEGRNAERRGEYLVAITDLLARQLGELAAAWAPDADNYRRAFEQDTRGALRKMLTGAIVLTSFELHGERLAVAYETQDQEQEHSCFSDTTHSDLEDDQAGILVVFTGQHAGTRFGPGLTACVRAHDSAQADDLSAKLARTLAALRAIPAPFDQAILGPDDAPGRQAILAALEALEAQTDAIAIAGRTLGFRLPLEPGR